MLEVFRKKKRSFIIIAAFFVIILVFIFWGAGPREKKATTSEVVATVDGTQITVKEYETLYKRQVDNYRKVFKGGNIDELLGKLNLKQKTMDVLVDRALILNEANRKKVGVTDKEVQDKIISMPVFQKDGVFDKELYFAVLGSNRINPADFEKGVEDELRMEKMRDAATGQAILGDEELRRLFDKENRQVLFDYIKVEAKRMAPKVEAAEDEAKKYFEKNGASFAVPTKMKAFYGYVDADELSKGMEMPEEALRDYYKRNIASYQRPGRVKARHILIRPDPKTKDKEEARIDARKKAEELRSRVKKGEDFASLAKKYSQDPGSAKEGGDLGYFGRGMMVKPFEDAAFALKKGDISPAVETEYGFHIIKADDVEREGVKPYEEVRGDIRNIAAKEEAGARARKVMSEVYELLKKDTPTEKLKAEAAKKGVKTVLTGFFTEKDTDNELVRDNKLKESVFAVEEKGTSGILESRNRFYVVKMVEKVEKHIPPFAEVRGDVVKAVKKEGAKKLAGDKAGELLKKAEAGESFSRLAKEGGYTAGKTGFFSLSQGFIPGLGLFVGDREDLFLLKKGSPVYPKVVAHEEDFYIFNLADGKEASEEEFGKKKDEFKENLLARKKEEALKKWLEDLKKSAKVTVNKELP
ncbi:MAG: SurA N-terminal domain-containing protein [Deltaproteobacteria bacterium]|nr:SurA N-terminal domain-containing protein [Deltaproteobacteria bacterium]